MSADIIKALDTEIRALETALEADPKYKRLRALREARSLYDEEEGIVSMIAKGSWRKATTISKRRSEATQAIIEAVTEILADAGPRLVRTTELVDRLEAQGIHIPGQAPVNNLSAILSYSKQFRANGRLGWRLVSEDEQGEEFEAVDEEPGQLIPPTASEHRLTNGGTHGGPVNPRPGGGT